MTTEILSDVPVLHPSEFEGRAIGRIITARIHLEGQSLITVARYWYDYTTTGTTLAYID
jgi:hypothetical protein